MSAAVVVAEHALARRLKQDDINLFLELGVPPLAMTRSWFRHTSFIGRERVVFDGAGRFEFERYAPGEEARNAYSVLLFNGAGDPADILAWRPDDHALWLGAVDLLGEEQLEAPRIDSEALDIWPSAIEWLAAERRGVVILSPRRAFEALRRASPLRVQSASQARALRQVLQRELPRIVVRDHPVQQRRGCAG